MQTTILPERIYLQQNSNSDDSLGSIQCVRKIRIQLRVVSKYLDLHHHAGFCSGALVLAGGWVVVGVRYSKGGRDDGSSNVAVDVMENKRKPVDSSVVRFWWCNKTATARVRIE